MLFIAELDSMLLMNINVVCISTFEKMKILVLLLIMAFAVTGSSSNRESVNFDHAWRFKLGYEDGAVIQCSNSDFPHELSDVQCQGLTPKVNINKADDCRDTCCACRHNVCDIAFANVSKEEDSYCSVTANQNGDLGGNLREIIDIQGLSHRQGDVYDDFHKNFPYKPLIGSECCSCGTQRGKDFKSDNILSNIAVVDKLKFNSTGSMSLVVWSGLYLIIMVNLILLVGLIFLRHLDLLI